MGLNIQDLEAEHAAAEVIEKLKHKKLPICPFAIAHDHEIEVHPKVSDDPGVSGFLMRLENGFGIMYATHIKSEGFIRFSVSHELGHYFIPDHWGSIFPPGENLHRSRSNFVSNDPIERQADVFATALLMPECLFIPALREAGEGFAAIESLANTCKTSITATAIRFAQHCEDPVAVLSSTGQVVNWCFMSESLRRIQGVRGIKKGTAVPPACETSKFNKIPSNVSSARRAAAWTSLDDWFDGAPQIEMKEDVVGLGSYGRTLTVLFTSEVIDSDDDADDED